MDLLEDLVNVKSSHRIYNVPTQVIWTEKGEETDSDSEESGEEGDNEGNIYSDTDNDSDNAMQSDKEDEENIGSETQVIELEGLKIVEEIRRRLGTEKHTKDATLEVKASLKRIQAQKLPQLAVDESEIVSLSGISAGDKCVKTASTFQGEEEDQLISKPSTEDRTQKISRLMAQLKEQRKLEEKQEHQAQLEADISHTTLTDDENDFYQYNDKTVTSDPPKATKKMLEEAEKFLNIQKRDLEIQPEFERKVSFKKQKLLEEFDDDSSTDDNQCLKSSKHPSVNSSPTTSPMKSAPQASREEDTHKPLRSAFETYANNIKQQLIFSPSKDRDVLILESEHSLDTEDDHISNPAREQKSSKDVPDLTKEEILAIKQRFLRKRLANVAGKDAPICRRTVQKGADTRGFLRNLLNTNREQLQKVRRSNPEYELLEQIEKEEEELGSLLEREIDRVKNIRRQEIAKKRKTLNYSKARKHPADISLDESEVPDSEIDFSSSPEQTDDESEEGLDSNSSTQDAGENYDSTKPSMETSEKSSRIKRRKKFVVDEDEHESIENSSEALQNKFAEVDELNEKRNDDSYMFGAQISGPVDKLDLQENSFITFAEHNNSNLQAVNLVSKERGTVLSSHEEEDEFLPRMDNMDSNIQLETQIIRGSEIPTRSPDGISPSLEVNESLGKHHDTPTQVDNLDLCTEKLSTTLRKIVDENQNSDILVDKLSQNKDHDKQRVPEYDSEYENDMKQQVKEYEAKLRRKELKLESNRKRLESSGIKNMIEVEAEESEDEWHGLGGIDAEIDDLANSEDEKILDNRFDVILNDEAVREKFMEQYKLKDRKELEKLLDDVKNHKLSKRVNNNGLDVELSDEEDAILTAYKRSKLQEQKNRLMANRKMKKLAEDDKCKAFFESIQDSTLAVKLDDLEERSDEGNSSSDDFPTQSDEKEGKSDSNSIGRKKFRIEESFVQRQLSFLSRNSESDLYKEHQNRSNQQHGFQTSDDDVDDLNTLKLKSFNSLTSKGQDLACATLKKSKDNESFSLNDDNDDDEIELLVPSLRRSHMPFESHRYRSTTQVQTDNVFTGVTISKQYKAVSKHKASITFLSKSKTNSTSNPKIQKIKDIISKTKQGTSASALFSNKGFDN